MNVSKDRWLKIGILLLAGVLVWVVAGTLEQRVVNAGDKAPEFSVVTEDGKTITLENFGGKLLVLNFWATWCRGCLEEMGSMDAFARQFAPKGVVVLAVSIDRNEKLYKRFLSQAQLSFPTSRDPEANISTEYGTFQYPESYIIDRKGKVIEKVIGGQNWMDPDFLKRVDGML